MNDVASSIPKSLLVHFDFLLQLFLTLITNFFEEAQLAFVVDAFAENQKLGQLLGGIDISYLLVQFVDLPTVQDDILPFVQKSFEQFLQSSLQCGQAFSLAHQLLFVLMYPVAYYWLYLCEPLLMFWFDVFVREYMARLFGTPCQISMDGREAKFEDLTISSIDIAEPLHPQQCESVAEAVNGEVDVCV